MLWQLFEEKQWHLKVRACRKLTAGEVRSFSASFKVTGVFPLSKNHWANDVIPSAGVGKDVSGGRWGESACFDRRLFVSGAKFGWVWQVATAAEIFHDSIRRNQRMLENNSRKQNNETKQTNKKSFARIKIVFAKTEQRITLLLVFHSRLSEWHRQRVSLTAVQTST